VDSALKFRRQKIRQSYLVAPKDAGGRSSGLGDEHLPGSV
jgi:hypothetical protein